MRKVVKNFTYEEAMFTEEDAFKWLIVSIAVYASAIAGLVILGYEDQVKNDQGFYNPLSITSVETSVATN
ncbi:hypothetical protein [Leptolyngbya sp. FACHB-261]|uniref:hypothetical protein n=1 Tax=Leptolyngbya sp. FACHB-261 TaxID=2692806 RepID=UPI0016897DB6|nr:hypothetical protein [Leptolyngbya sp. FACHB-261]MBD2104899.1 hypothetical protein [Leptolyngbya sp. FACHB-261]